MHMNTLYFLMHYFRFKPIKHFWIVIKVYSPSQFKLNLVLINHAISSFCNSDKLLKESQSKHIKMYENMYRFSNIKE